MVSANYYRIVDGKELIVPPPHWFNGYPDWWLKLPENKDLYKKEPKTELVSKVK